VALRQDATLGLGFVKRSAVGEDHCILAADGNDTAGELQTHYGGHQVSLDDVARTRVELLKDGERVVYRRAAYCECATPCRRAEITSLQRQELDKYSQLI
jgi:hypothetical protein